MGHWLLFDLEHFNIANGLPARSTYYIVEDLEGYIWFSTQFGIHRFDGTRYKNYQGEKMGIPSRAVPVLGVDGANRIWCRSLIGGKMLKFSILDPATDSILTVEEVTQGRFKDSDITAFTPIHGKEKGVLLVTADGTLYQYRHQCQEIGVFPGAPIGS